MGQPKGPLDVTCADAAPTARSQRCKSSKKRCSWRETRDGGPCRRCAAIGADCTEPKAEISRRREERMRRASPYRAPSSDVTPGHCPPVAPAAHGGSGMPQTAQQSVPQGTQSDFAKIEVRKASELLAPGNVEGALILAGMRRSGSISPSPPSPPSPQAQATAQHLQQLPFHGVLPPPWALAQQPSQPMLAPAPIRYAIPAGYPIVGCNPIPIYVAATPAWNPAMAARC